jgi:hypothetical protein
MYENLIGYTEDFNAELNVESSFIRGLVINALTMLERTIDAFISIHFCRDQKKSIELMSNVFATKYITFEAKRLIFKSITDNHHKDYKQLNLKNIHAKLDEFNLHRNTLAHCVIDLKPDSIELFKRTKHVTFLIFDKSINTKVYSRDMAAKIVNEIYDFIKPIAKMIDI